jgi:hypothetical protein
MEESRHVGIPFGVFFPPLREDKGKGVNVFGESDVVIRG